MAPRSTIECPVCKGFVGHARGQALEHALERHIVLSHTVVKAPKAKAPEETPAPQRRFVRKR